MASDESSPNLRALEFASQTLLRSTDMGLVAMRYLVVCAVPYGHRKTRRTCVSGYGLGSSRAFEAPLNCDFQFSANARPREEAFNAPQRIFSKRMTK